MVVPEVVMHVHTWVEIVIGVAGFGGIILGQWRNGISLKNEVAGVKREMTRLVDKQSELSGRTRDIEIMCAKTHGFTSRSE